MQLFLISKIWPIPARKKSKNIIFLKIHNFKEFERHEEENKMPLAY